MKTSHGLAIDGFMRGSTSGASSPQKSTKITESSNLLNTKTTGTKLKSAAQGVHQRAQRSQTLMRSAVAKPVKSLSTTAAVRKAKNTASLDGARNTRAKTISQNAKVRRFGHVHGSGKSVEQSQSSIKAIPAAPKKAAAAERAVPAPLPSLVTSVSHRQLERMLDEALTKADAHKKAMSGRLNPSLWQKIKFAPRWLTLGVSLIVLVAVAGYVAWQRVPQVAMRVASTRAHVPAKIPAYVPSGFSLATPVKTEKGSVSVKFKANDSSSRSFTLTQKSSNMDSKSLQDSVVPHDAQVQTSEVNGTTVYIYGQQNDAAWVNHGVQYLVHDTANLNSDQLLKLAGSL